MMKPFNFVDIVVNEPKNNNFNSAPNKTQIKHKDIFNRTNEIAHNKHCRKEILFSFLSFKM